jgi:hypothetical protein
MMESQTSLSQSLMAKVLRRPQEAPVQLLEAQLLMLPQLLLSFANLEQSIIRLSGPLSRQCLFVV